MKHKKQTSLNTISDHPLQPPPVHPPTCQHLPSAQQTVHSHKRGSPRWWQLVKRSGWLTVGIYHSRPLVELVEAPWVEGTPSQRAPLIWRVRCYQFQYCCLSFFLWSQRQDFYLFYDYKNLAVESVFLCQSSVLSCHGTDDLDSAIWVVLLFSLLLEEDPRLHKSCISSIVFFCSPCSGHEVCVNQRPGCTLLFLFC